MADDLPKQLPQQSADEWADRVAGYIERALLIAVGATVTIVAGFLSQVWASASVAFRTELATNLKALGTLFVAAFMLPTLRFFVELYRHDDAKRARKAFILWCLFAVLLFGYYTRVIDQLGDIVLRYAKLTS